MVRLFWPSLQSIKNVAETLSLPIDSIARTQGWLRSVKQHKKVVFGRLDDGLSSDNIQVVFDTDERTKQLRSQCFVDVTGRLVISPGPSQAVELQCTQLHRLHSVDTSDDTFAPHLTALACQHNRQDLATRTAAWQHWRQFATYRARWRPFAALLRARAGLVRLLQRHLDGQGFLHVHTPVLTGADSEGAGQVFSVTSSVDVQQQPSELEKDADGLYFGTEAHLTVSGQLHLEALACGITRVYCLGPAFRAELSRTRRHLSEFFMLESELAAVDDCHQLCDHVEQLLRSVVLQFVEQHRADLEVIHTGNYLAVLEERLRAMFTNQFVRLTYSEAVDRLSAAASSPGFSCEQLKPGDDLQRKHEMALVSLCGDRPVFVTSWPAHLKPFYMKRRQTDWVECMDLLVPDIGELVGGSLREDSADQLISRMTTNGSSRRLQEQLEWYWQLRRFGCPPSAGYGLGVERLLMLVAGIASVRDTLPFPRWYQHCPA